MAPSSRKGSIVLTGSNGGLGSAIARHISKTPDLSSEYHGVFVVRKAETAATLRGILDRAPATFLRDTVSIDLTRLSSVRSGAKWINAAVADGSIPPIRALIISAGYQELTDQSFTPDGFDTSFQVNYLSQFVLVLLLLQSLDREHGRIVILSGYNHDTEDPRNDMQGLFKDEKYKPMFHDTETLAKGKWSTPQDDPSSLAGSRRYGAAHLLEVMFMRELQKRLNSDPVLSKISVLGLDPGAMPTDICRRDSFATRVLVMKVLMPLINPICVYFWPNGTFRTPAKSGKDALRAAFDTETLGEYPKDVYLNGSDAWKPSKESDNESKREELWRDSVALANIVEGETALTRWT
ncbi:hypothetical protein F4778DRAFT_71996 [Xylariomycetidae sp. FL2044]|nr:hypothetical protein F4778DRAFT_71996 [Xylariomycetidae sp. FL2044]